MASDLEFGRGSDLWEYWIGPEGLAHYAGALHPWTTLRDALITKGVPVTQANGLATNIMQATPEGRALFAAHHGAGEQRAVTMASGGQGTVLPKPSTIVQGAQDNLHAGELSRVLGGLSDDDVAKFAQLCDDACDEMGQ